MGHDVRYVGELIFKKLPTVEHLELVKYWQENVDYFSAYKLSKCFLKLQVDNNCEKLYPYKSFNVLVEFTKALKKAGNDFIDGCYICSVSEYGFDDESQIFLYRDNNFLKLDLLKVVDLALCKLDNIKDFEL